MKRIGVLLCGAAFVLAGCVSGGGSMSSAVSESGAERPIMDLPPTNAAERAAQVHVELGTAYVEIGRYDVALDEARIALAYQSGYPPAFHLMGIVYTFIEDNTAARENFLRALRAAPNDPDFNNSYGWFLCLNGAEQEGLRRLDLAARNPYYRFPARPHTNAGLCQLRLDDVAAAEGHFRRALALQAENAVALYWLAELAQRQGDYLAAQRHLVALHRLAEPTPESAWLGLRVERKLGNHHAEASYAAQLSGRFRNSPEYQAMTRGEYE